MEVEYEQTSGSACASRMRCDSSRNAAWQSRMGPAMLLSVAHLELAQYIIFALFYLLGTFVKEYSVRIITCLHFLKFYYTLRGKTFLLSIVDVVCFIYFSARIQPQCCFHLDQERSLRSMAAHSYVPVCLAHHDRYHLQPYYSQHMLRASKIRMFTYSAASWNLSTAALSMFELA